MNSRDHKPTTPELRVEGRDRKGLDDGPHEPIKTGLTSERQLPASHLAWSMSFPGTLPADDLAEGRAPSEEYELHRNGDSLRVSVGSPAPSWLEAVLHKLQELLYLEADWNSYGAPPITFDAIRTALEVLGEVVPRRAPAPTIVPTVDGGVQLEWHRGGIDLEIEITSPHQAVAYFAQQETSEEWEDDLFRRGDAVRRCLERLAA